MNIGSTLTLDLEARTEYQIGGMQEDIGILALGLESKQ